MRYSFLIPAILGLSILCPAIASAITPMTCDEFIKRPMAKTEQDKLVSVIIMSYLTGVVDGAMRADEPNEQRLGYTRFMDHVVKECRINPKRDYRSAALEVAKRMARMGLLKDPPASATGLPQPPAKNPADD